MLPISALNRKPRVVVSGDPHLLKLERYESVPIVTLAEAVKRLGL